MSTGTPEFVLACLSIDTPNTYMVMVQLRDRGAEIVTVTVLPWRVGESIRGDSGTLNNSQTEIVGRAREIPLLTWVHLMASHHSER